MEQKRRLKVMSTKFYTFNQPKKWPWDLRPYLNQNTVNEKEEDDIFIKTLLQMRFIRAERNRKIKSFLGHHLKHTNAKKFEFLDHTKGLVQAHESSFGPYGLILGVIYDWIERQRGQLIDLSQVIAKEPGKKKVDNNFDNIIRDEVRMKMVLDTLSTKDIIDSQSQWKGIKTSSGKSELVALSYILMEDGIIKPLPYTEMARIFNKKFRTEISQGYFRRAPKNSNIDRVRNELNSIIK